MYYVAKISQALGLGIIVVGFIFTFPELINSRYLLPGLLLFLFGWLIQRYMLGE